MEKSAADLNANDLDANDRSANDLTANSLTEDLSKILSATEPLWEELRNQRLFITGGTGFFGCWLLETLIWANDRRGLNVEAIVLTREPHRFRNKIPHLANHRAVHLHQGDVRDFVFPEGKFSHVIHAATEANALLNTEHPDAMLDTIVQGTRRCLEFARAAGTKKFLFASSGAVYGTQPPELSHIPETFAGGPDPLALTSAYAEGKRIAELYCALTARSGTFEAKIARCFAFVGPYMKLDAHFAIGNFIRDHLAGGPIRVMGDGSAVRSYFYASDLMIWLWTILFKGQNCRAYNVGSERAISMGELAREISAAWEPNMKVEIRGAPSGGPAHRYVPLATRAGTELGLSQRIGLREALRRTREWFDQNMSLESRSDVPFSEAAARISRACPICQNHMARILHRESFVLPDGHPLSKGYAVVCCQKCGFVYADTVVSQADFDKFYRNFSKYEDAQTSTGSGESRRDQARLMETAAWIAAQVPDRTALIVDIGCAGGGLLHQLRALGFTRLIGVDPSPACIRNVKARDLDAYVGTLLTLPDLVSQSDCVILSHVLEHVQDVPAALETAHKILKPGGLLYVEVPDATRYVDLLYAPFQDFNTEHINHFSAGSLDNALRTSGFVPEKCGTRTLEIAEDTFYPAIYGFFRCLQNDRKSEWKSDTKLEEAIRRYISASNELMEKIDRHLAACLKDVPGIVLWGMGQTAMKILGLNCMKSIPLIACVDSNPINHGMNLRGAPITGPEGVRREEYPIVVATLLHHREILEQIRTRGIKNEVIFLLDDAERRESA